MVDRFNSWRAWSTWFLGIFGRLGPIFVLVRPGRARPDVAGDTDEEPLKFERLGPGVEGSARAIPGPMCLFEITC